MRAGVVDTVLRRDGDHDAAVFERARRLGFAGVEVVLRRGALSHCATAARVRFGH